MSPSIAYGWIWNAIPNLAIQFPKMVLAGGLRTGLACASHKHIGASRFRYSWSPESLPKCLSLCQGFRFIPRESNQFFHMTRLLLMYYINMKLWLPEYHLIHSTSLSLSSRALLIICKHINSSIRIDLLCDTLISIICAKIALHSRGLSSYWTLLKPV
jgi:hypothetical protein